MPTYDVKVVVEYNYEVEAENDEQAKELGWKYEDYSHFAEVYSIDIDEHYPADYDEEDE